MIPFRALIRVLIGFLMAILVVSCSIEEESKEVIGTPELDEIIESGLRESYYTGAVLVIGNSRGVVVEKAYGYADLYNEDLRVVAEPDSITTDHLFDLASLTKIFGTTLAVMKLHSDGLIELDESVSEFLPEFSRERLAQITVRSLLNHSSGLMQWYPTFYEVARPSDFLSWLAGRSLISEPGESRNYSDLGFMVLAEIVEKAAGRSMDQYLQEEVYREIGLSETGFNPDAESADVVATSHGNPFEKKMVYDKNFGYRINIDPEKWNGWRNYTLKGEVNDGNAHYTFDGVAGHAGLFSTGRELAKLLQLILNGGEYNGNQIISEETIEEFTRKDQYGNGLGWAMDEGTLHADNLPLESVGHAGFTGTNFVLSPESDLFYIFLTNRQHVGVDERGDYPNLREIRTRLASEVFSEFTD
ncbi:serine hydrolase domain-containing protein [Rhodohalobacter halophilus]|uniref:serine hydrolase domain-containing protein n=1 Tax=Rhodohalobacter halophilus TaxID=1812810 RepID=UPI00083F8F7E|nr:serine hydrolase [Rhodohalobacter halophilus]